MIRQPIIACSGTSTTARPPYLDRIRSTAIAAKEVGGITQHIGASEVPIDAIDRICGPLLRASNIKHNHTWPAFHRHARARGIHQPEKEGRQHRRHSDTRC